jgi:hypothetical protein
MEKKWMQTWSDEVKANFAAKRFMDDNPLAPRICSGSAESALLFFWGFVVGNIGDEYIKEAVFRTTSSSSKIFPAPHAWQTRQRTHSQR